MTPEERAELERLLQTTAPSEWGQQSKWLSDFGRMDDGRVYGPQQFDLGAEASLMNPFAFEQAEKALRADERENLLHPPAQNNPPTYFDLMEDYETSITSNLRRNNLIVPYELGNLAADSEARAALNERISREGSTYTDYATQLGYDTGFGPLTNNKLGDVSFRPRNELFPTEVSSYRPNENVILTSGVSIDQIADDMIRMGIATPEEVRAAMNSPIPETNFLLGNEVIDVDAAAQTLANRLSGTVTPNDLGMPGFGAGDVADEIKDVVLGQVDWGLLGDTSGLDAVPGFDALMENVWNKTEAIIRGGNAVAVPYLPTTVINNMHHNENLRAFVADPQKLTQFLDYYKATDVSSASDWLARELVTYGDRYRPMAGRDVYAAVKEIIAGAVDPR